MIQPKAAYRFFLVLLFAVFIFTSCNEKKTEKKEDSTEQKMDTVDTKPTKDGD